jgi:hypothetical protein
MRKQDVNEKFNKDMEISVQALVLSKKEKKKMKILNLRTENLNKSNFKNCENPLRLEQAEERSLDIEHNINELEHMDSTKKKSIEQNTTKGTNF